MSVAHRLSTADSERPSLLQVPELEVARRYLQACMASHPVTAVEIATPRVLPGVPRAEAVDLFLGQPVRQVDREGRNLILHIGAASLLLLVRGQATVFAAASGLELVPPKTMRLSLQTGGGRLWYCDDGNSARAAVIRNPGGMLARNEMMAGVEPLSTAFTLLNFKRILKRKKRTIQQILVDDELIAGIGNQYADEILYVAKLRPARQVSTLKQEEVRQLYYSILEILQKAIRFGGIGEESNWHLAGQTGTFQRFLNVFGREGQACPSCRARIRVASIGKVQSYFCPRCQQ